MLDKETKKKVTEDWQNAFSQLSLYAQDKLYKVVGPLIIGLELVKLPRANQYRPHFVVYPLWKNNIKANLDFPIILSEYYDKKGLQYSIPFEKHDVFISDAIDSVKSQTPLPFDGDIEFKKIVAVIDGHSNRPPLSAAPNSYLQAVIQEAKLKVALFIGILEAQIVFGQIKNRNWDTTHFKACGVNLNEWLHELQHAISNRESFLKKIEINKLDKKISQMKNSNLKGIK